MTGKIILNTLGAPELLTEDFEDFTPKIRRATALIAYLSRQPGYTETRDNLASLLWSESAKPKASSTLRQTIQHLRKVQDEIGLEFILSDGPNITLIADLIETDQSKILKSLISGLTPSNNKATRLWRGEFLEGFEDIDVAYTNWLNDERGNVHEQLEQAASNIIQEGSYKHGDDHIEAVASFLLWMDPSDEFAHAALIRLYAEQGSPEKAKNQYDNCSREMRKLLGKDPSVQTREMLEVKSKNEFQRMIARIGTSKGIEFPTILISDASFGNDLDARAQSVREGIVSGLSSFKSLNIHETSSTNVPNSEIPALLSHDQGAYALRFRYDPFMECMNIRLEDKADGLIIFSDFVDLANDVDRNRISHAIQMMSNRIHDGTIKEAKKKNPLSPFAFWHETLDLLLKFRNDTDIEAMSVLDEISAIHTDFSPAYSAKASVYLKRNMVYPHLGEDQLGYTKAQQLLKKSITLDPWSSVSLRGMGWAHIAKEEWAEATHVFKQALETSPLDPFNAISVAEGLAIAGETGIALKISDKALQTSINTPELLYSYVGNIHLAAGNYARANDYLKRSPKHNISALVALLTAQTAGGMNDEVPETKKLINKASSENFGTELTGKADQVLNWWQKRFGFANPSTNRAFKAVLPTVAEVMTQP